MNCTTNKKLIIIIHEGKWCNLLLKMKPHKISSGIGSDEQDRKCMHNVTKRRVWIFGSRTLDGQTFWQQSFLCGHTSCGCLQLCLCYRTFLIILYQYCISMFVQKIQQDATAYQNFISYLYEAQHVSGDTPPVIRSLKLHQPKHVQFHINMK